MRLAEFILHEMQVIIAEWEAFAAMQLPAAAGMTPLALRDHAQQILQAVAADLASPQTPQEQSEKSRGRAPMVSGAPETAAQTHAVLRARSGFDIKQLVAEYRALRASVLRLWLDASPFERSGVEDVIRFNEAIDQAIAESVGHFDAQVEQARNLLLGILGHDMRNPLNNIVMTAQYLTALNAGEQVSVAAGRLIRSGASMQALLDDLTDFNRLNLGLGLNVVAADVDLAGPVADELEQLQGAHPNRVIELSVSGDVRGRWDGHRVQQLLRNLVVNAIGHGAPDSPVRVALRGADAEVTLEVMNSGPPIDAAVLSQMFEPLRRGVPQEDKESRGGLGLGLFIVRAIANGHGGEVAVRSDGGEIAFAVRLPRQRRDDSHPGKPGGRPGFEL
ncbi:MAG TPA: sensor histidine kinase [Longimicrobiales bacterium]|nr:sensor histidine kinase [Longimicrobiales bacterium]